MEYSEKKVNLTENTYQLGRIVATPILKEIYNPIIINKSVIPKDDNRSVIYAPNHRTTLDPFAIITATNDPIHWVALKRFFDAKDSIFNNNKNAFLCYLTKYLFISMGFIPIDRESNNLESLRLMNKYLKEGRNLGIFPEGTTNKHPDLYDIGPVQPGLITMARANDSWIQPISLLWIENDKIDNKIIINFREPYLASQMTKKEGTDLWVEEVQEGINQNREVVRNLSHLVDDDSIKKMILKIK